MLSICKEKHFLGEQTLCWRIISQPCLSLSSFHCRCHHWEHNFTHNEWNFILCQLKKMKNFIAWKSLERERQLSKWWWKLNKYFISMFGKVMSHDYEWHMSMWDSWLRENWRKIENLNHIMCVWRFWEQQQEKKREWVREMYDKMLMSMFLSLMTFMNIHVKVDRWECKMKTLASLLRTCGWENENERVERIF